MTTFFLRMSLSKMRLEFMGMTLKENNRHLNGRVQVLNASRKHDRYSQK
jgi:hypothetical protein